MGLFDNLFGSNDLIAVIKRGDWSTVISECQVHPHKARVWSVQHKFFDGEHDSHILPLHQAVVMSNPSIEAINALIHAYPHALLCKESAYKRLPIHLACQNQQASTGLIRLLLSYSPDAAMERDSLGRLAIHYAVSNDASVHAIDTILRVNPQAASTTDLHDWLPIHVACRHGSSFLVIQRLMDAYPDGVVARTERGSTPLDLMKNVDCAFKPKIVEMLTQEMRENMATVPPVHPGASFYQHPASHKGVKGHYATMAAH
jgi:hypothetical protein